MSVTNVGYLPSNSKYESYFNILAFFSFITFALELMSYIINWSKSYIPQKWIGGISLGLLILIAFGALLERKSDFRINVPVIDSFFICILKNKPRGVTVLFFLYLCSVLIFVFQDGGSENSFFINIFLLSSNLGFFFAKKQRVKNAALILCIGGYLLVGLVYTDYSSCGVVFKIPNFLGFLVALATILFSTIINNNITLNIEKKTENSND